MKWCNGCSILKERHEFSKDKTKKDGLTTKCKDCHKIYYNHNKIEINNKVKKYQINNKEVVAERKKKYTIHNKEKIIQYNKQYREDNREALVSNGKDYWNTNRKRLIENNKEYRNSKSKYLPYYKKLTIDESPIILNSKYLGVKCKYCGKYFIPSNTAVSDRIKALNYTNKGDNFLYCSYNCKQACPVYRQQNFPKGFKKASSREVNPLVRQMCFERDDWKCQICGATQEEAPLHCHHIEGYTQNPRLGNDVTNCITLCKMCHKEVHKLPGCGYNELKCITK
jgi:uncharacterized OB-fold protein